MCRSEKNIFNTLGSPTDSKDTLVDRFPVEKAKIRQKFQSQIFSSYNVCVFSD